jgi:hypothetical protein
MVRNKRTAWLVLLGLVVLLIYGNCYQIKLPEPKNIKLPEATMKGKNTFGCMVNGENFKNKNYWQVILVIPTKIKGLLSSYNNTSYDKFAALFDFQMNAEMTYIGTQKNLSLYLSETEPFKTGKLYTINGKGNSASFYDDNDFMYYGAQENHPLGITFTRFDTTANIASGTFNGTLINSDPAVGATIEITEGRFDVKFNHN